jgi:hypothetical protein
VAGIFNIVHKLCSSLWIVEEDESCKQHPRLGIIRLKAHNLFKERVCFRGLTRLEELLRLLQLFSVGARERLLQPALDGMLRQRTKKFINNLSVDEKLHVGNTLDPVLLCHIHVFLSVNFRQIPPAAILLSESF